MTLPYERTRAVVQTESFLRSLIDPKQTPNVPKKFRLQAAMLLRHYPSKSDISVTASGWDEKIVRWVTECPFADPSDKFV